MGRPSSYTQATADRICLELAEGRSLRAICAAEDMPDRDTVRRWLKENNEFHGQYARAREDQAHTLMDEIIELSDEAVDKENAAAIKVRVDTRFRVAANLAPKAYGVKSTVEMNVTTDIAAVIEEGRKRAREE